MAGSTLCLSSSAFFLALLQQVGNSEGVSFLHPRSSAHTHTHKGAHTHRLNCKRMPLTYAVIFSSGVCVRACVCVCVCVWTHMGDLFTLHTFLSTSPLAFCGLSKRWPGLRAAWPAAPLAWHLDWQAWKRTGGRGGRAREVMSFQSFSLSSFLLVSVHCSPHCVAVMMRTEGSERGRERGMEGERRGGGGAVVRREGRLHCVAGVTMAPYVADLLLFRGGK